MRAWPRAVRRSGFCGRRSNFSPGYAHGPETAARVRHM
jgi:hypothetical protein